MRDGIFISHATPEDNSYAIWLASRLNSLGYNTWIDKNALLGGEKFWEEIDQVIRHSAAKFLLVYSQSICIDKKPGHLKDGIYKEYSLAESISKQEGIRDFIILLNIDASTHNLFIGADRLVQIPFYDNWAEGLRQLLKKLEKDNIPKNVTNQVAEFTEWYENKYITRNGIVSGKKELYYSTFWPIPELPKHFYIYQLESEEEALSIYKGECPYPIGKIANILSSFSPEIPQQFQVAGNDHTAHLKGRSEIDVDSILSGFGSTNFPTHRDCTNHLRTLLTRVFHLLMKKRGMFWYELANKKQAYYFTPANLHGGNVTFEYPFRRGKKEKKKGLFGEYLSLGKWHYAVSCKPTFAPFRAFSLKSHLAFTEKGFEAWEDKDKIHTHRRSKGKRLFNEEWRDMFLGFVNAIKDKEGEIKIALSSDFILKMDPSPMLFWADFGYFEPKSGDRQDVLNQYEEETDEEEPISGE
jgi:hypothetical protein